MGQSDGSPQPTVSIRPRTRTEEDAYMEGQLNALRLTERKGIEYARWIIEGSQKMIREAREL